MKSIRLKNLRCIPDSGDFNIKPINILVGTNSSGKSTFLRTFPLFRQSFEADAEEPLLWFGKLVDFGSFEEVVNRRSINKEIGIEFSFSVTNPTNTYFRSRYLFGYHAFQPWFMDQDIENNPIDIALAATIKKKENSDQGYLSRVEIVESNNKYIIEFEENCVMKSICVNGFEFEPKILKIFSYKVKGLLPEITVDVPGMGNIKKDDSIPMMNQVLEAANSLGGGKIKISKEEAAQIIFRHSNFGSSDDGISKAIKQAIKAKRWISFSNQIKQNSEKWDQLKATIASINIHWLLPICNQYLGQWASSIYYLGPTRATAQRYYRIQGLSVKDIDYRGENLAMFIRSLSRPALDDFSKFCSDHFQFEIETKNSAGHIEICIKDQNAADVVNMADMGFGYSQLLPVIAQVWSLTNQSNGHAQGQHILAIEQPELHLHPSYQAKLADLFVGVYKHLGAKGGNYKFIIETHSEYLINRIGDLIEAGSISSDDVQVLVFNQDKATLQTTTTIANFNNDGSLSNWPFGFFNY